MCRRSASFTCAGEFWRLSATVRLFKTYCVSCGRKLYLELVPSISGPVKIFVGNQVYISGVLGIASGHVLDAPELHIKDRVFLGHQVSFRVSREDHRRRGSHDRAEFATLPIVTNTR